MEIKTLFEKLCEKPRPSGSEQISVARSDISSILKRHKYIVINKHYPFIGWKLIKNPEVKFVKPVKKNAKCLPVVWSVATKKQKNRGTILPFFEAQKTFEAYQWQKYTVVDNEGQIVSYLLTRPDQVWVQPLDNHLYDKPVIIVDTESCKLINEWIYAKETIEVEVSNQTEIIPNLQITNILVYPHEDIPPILVSAHYDTMFNTVGAHDNTSGTIVLIKLIERFSENAIDNVGFIFFDAEEWNKYGAYSYANELKKNNQIRNVKLLINIDSVGVGDHLYFLVSPDLGPKVSNILKSLKNKVSLRVDVTQKSEFPQFDSWPFMKNNIPVIQIGSLPSFKYFHDPKDNLENLNYDFIKIVIDFISEFILKLKDQI